MNCDQLARWYRWLEYLGMGRALERRRFQFLPELAGECRSDEIGGSLPFDKDARSPGAGDEYRVLLLGDGDGRFLSRLVEVRSFAQVDYVDSSREMLALARQRVTRQLGAEQVARRVVFHCADARSWCPQPSQRYRCVITHFFLDCLTTPEVDELVRRLVPFLEKETAWVVSEFHQPERGFRAWRARVWIGGLYRVFGWATGLRVRELPDYRRSLQAHGFQMEREVVADVGLLVSEWWQRRQ